MFPEYKQCTTIGTFDKWEQVRTFVNVLVNKSKTNLEPNFETVLVSFLSYLCQEFAYFMFVMVMSLLLPVLIMLASYIAIVFVIFRFSKRLDVFTLSLYKYKIYNVHSVFHWEKYGN